MMNTSKSLSDIHRGKVEISSKQHEHFLAIIQRLLEIIKELQNFKSKVKTLEKLNTMDVNDIIDSLLHSLSDEDKNKFKTGMEFMRNELKIVLSS